MNKTLFLSVQFGPGNKEFITKLLQSFGNLKQIDAANILIDVHTQ